MESLGDKVSRIIYRAIIQSIKRKSYKLPSVRSLALSAETSNQTIQKILKKYVLEGYVTSRRGAGIFVSEAVITGEVQLPLQPLNIESKVRSEKIAKQIFDDILRNSSKRNNHLPSIVELESVYNANYRTIKRAFALLEEKGFIDSTKKMVSGAPLQRRHKHNEIICIVRTTGTGLFLANTEEIIKNLQQICSQRKLSLRVVKLYYVQSKLYFVNNDDEKQFFKIPSDGPFGCIILSVGIADGFSDLMDMLRSRFTGPKVLLGQPSITRQFENYSHRSSIVNLTTESSLIPGKKVGSYLYAMGHRKLVFFPGAPETQWSLVRYWGIKEVYDMCGKENAITFCKIPEIHTASYDKFWNKIVMNDFRNKIGPLIAMASKTANIFNFEKFQSSDIHEILKTQFKKNHIRNLLVKAYKPFLPTIIKNHHASAIVCDDDNLAAIILMLLKKHNISVPRDISVIGFDDSYEAMISNLTSYNFNSVEQLNCVIDWLLHSRSETKSASIKKRFESAGYVTIRGSVADLSRV